jgi:hypothetical protein
MPEGDLKARNPAIAGLLSFLLPGLGQLYNGQPQLALLVFAIVYGGATMCGLRFIGALGAADPRGALGTVLFWGGLTTFAWLGGVVQAVFTALERAEYFLARYNHPLVYLGIVVAAYGLAPALLGRTVFQWMLTRNGIRTEQQVAEWRARMDALRSGTAAARRPQAVQAQSPSPAPTLTGAEPIELPDPEIAARGAATAIHLVLVGGPDGGVYDMHTAQPTCTFRPVPEASWTNLYANPADSLGVTAVQFRVVVDTGTTTAFQINVNLGNVPRGRAYFVEGRAAAPGDSRPSATVVRRGTGAVIRIVGETAERVRIEATVHCRQVLTE